MLCLLSCEAVVLAIFFPDRIQDCVEETVISLKYPGVMHSMA